jgi:septal ring factor EnvC (AmiA/AmiB activator)
VTDTTATAGRTARVRAAIDAMGKAGEPLTISALARRSRVSRQFLYRHPELRAEVLRRQAAQEEAYTNGRSPRDEITAASLRAELAHAEEQNRRLRATLARLEARLSHVLGAEVAAEAGLSTADELRGLRSQVCALEGDVGRLRDELRERTDELDACRARNRELLAQLNRPAPNRRSRQ